MATETRRLHIAGKFSDIIGGSGGSDKKILLEETTIAFGDDGSYYGAQLDTPFTLVANKTYYVKWDGTTYKYTAKTVVAGAVILGDESGDTRDPFAILYIQGGTNGFPVDTISISTDSTEPTHIVMIWEEASAGVSSWNDLTDKPFYEEGPIELSPATDVDGFENNSLIGFHSVTLALGVDIPEFTMVAGYVYNVIWNGTVHDNLIAYAANVMDTDVVYIGGGDLISSDYLTLNGNGEPFVIICSTTEATIVSTTDHESTKHSVGLTQITTNVKTLDPKFIPMEAIDERIDAYISAALEGDYGGVE